MRGFSPRRKPLQALLGRIARAYSETASTLPEQIATEPTAPEEETGPAVRLLRQLAIRLRQAAEENLELTPRRLVEEILAARPDPKRHPLVREYASLYAQTATRVADLWRGIRFHLEVAADDLEEAEAGAGAQAPSLSTEGLDSATLALEMLAEAEQGLRTALAPLSAFVDGLPAELTREHQAFARSLRQELESIGSWDKTLRHLLRRLYRKGLELKERSGVLLEQGREEVSRSASSGISQTGSLLRNLQSLLGKGGKTEETLLALTDLPTRSQMLERSESLPPLYRRLFTLGPLRNREFLVAREEEFEELEEVFQRWQSGRTCSLAVIGPEGSGKTSLLNCFENQYGSKGEFWRTEIRGRLRSEAEVFDLFRQWLQPPEEVASLDALIAHLLASPRRILVVEGGHHLALRVVGGHQATRAFLHVLMATRGHCLWLVTFRKFPWNRLDYQIGIGQFFTHQIRTLFHDQQQLREAILLRHRTSGLPILYPEGEGKGASATGGQARAEAAFFQELFNASSGNIEAAIYFWLLAASYDEAEKALRLSPLSIPEYGFLRALGRDHLFALSEVVSHGNLSVEEYCRIFHKETLEGRLLLDYLVQLRILQTDSGGAYSVNPIFLGPSAQTLESLNILY